MLYQDLIYSLAFLKKFSSSFPEEEINLVDFSSCQHLINFSCNLENDLIQKINLLCKGCILFKASSNAICLEIEGKSKKEGIKIIQKFLNMLDSKCEENEIHEENLKLFWKFQFSKTRKDCLSAGAQAILNYLLTI